MFFILPLGPQQDDLLEEATVHRPYVTGALALVSVVVFLYWTANFDAKQAFFFNFNYGFQAEHPFSAGLFAYQFIHADFWHLFGNMLFLIPFGTLVECKAGHLAALVVYMLAGVGGAWAEAMVSSPIPHAFKHLHAEIYVPLVGASGSIMGLVGAVLPVAPLTNIRMLVGIGRFWRIVPVPAWIVGVLYLVKELVLGIAESGHQGGTAYMCHVGGILSGAAAGLLLLPRVRQLELDFYDRNLPPLPKKPLRAPPPDPLAQELPPAAPRPPRQPRKPLKPPVPVMAPVPEPSPLVPSPLEPPPPVVAEPPPPPVVEPPPSVPEPVGAQPYVPPTERTGSEPEIVLGAKPLDVPEASREVEVPAQAVPANQDVGNVTGTWARSWRLADIQDKLNRARALEKDASKVASVAQFYHTVLTNNRLPAGHRVYAGARLSRLLLRHGQVRQSAVLAAKLLQHELPAEMKAHVHQTYASAAELLRAAKKQNPQS
jgi:membrane associated rhomboid family serine protease